MYPNLYYLFKDLFNIDLPALRVLNSFGFFVALAFLSAAWVLTKEFKRMEKIGALQGFPEKIWIGKPASFLELLINFLVGFLVGYKIIAIFFTENALDNPQHYIFSSQGNIWLGVAGGALFCYLKWKEKNKNVLKTPKQETLIIYPHQRVGDLVIYGAIFGFSGAKLFDILESPSQFLYLLKAVWAGRQNALSLFFSGLTFYGGLIVAGIAIILYARKYKMNIMYLCDAFGPALMLAYAVGRIGCQVAGDGDWGIVNSAYITNNLGAVTSADTVQFNQSLSTYANYLNTQLNATPATLHQLSLKSFAGLPDFLFASSYAHNVLDAGVPLANCAGEYCNYLPLPVFPTPLYESIFSLLLFFVLWQLRKKLKYPGQLFGIYLIFNGTERFLIEKIRVNDTYSILGSHITQAEIISLCLILMGITIYYFAAQKKFINKLPIPQ